ncbi:RNA polymerase-binding protein DksA [Solimonas variicoloris]|uniref:RNA polymerase-binding protein DksA n=1 Tax=Solimonas variicoloris TaxID=254408 RepID=UPI00039E1854|nr:RNA polymerase-binding protein DksA [Solimonas variicoloris]
MKAKKTSAKKAATTKAAKAAPKKTAAAPKSVPKSAGPLKKAKSAPQAKAAAKTRVPAKSGAAGPSPKKIVVTSAAGNVKVQEKSKSPAKAAPAKTSASKVATAAKVVRAPQKIAPRAPGALLSEDDIRAMSDDEYMNDAQLEFFRQRLIHMREEVLQREVDVKERLHEREMFADPADRATAEEEHWLDLRLRERESLLLKKIDDALRRIEAKEYGYCEKTGDPIGIPRLLARPTATVCVDVKGQDERVEAQFRDR